MRLYLLKCSYKTYKLRESKAAGGFFSKIFGIQNPKYTSVTCARCTFTEFYKTKTSGIGNVFDFVTC